MKQQVNDITEVLAGLSSQLESMRKTIDDQHATICQINRTCQRQLKEIKDLRKGIKGKGRTIEDLRSRLSKYEEPPKDSGNSTTPPSKEPMKAEIVRRTKTLRMPTGKKPGGQPGHEGHTLGISGSPDLITGQSAEFCDACGDSLDGCDRELDYITQIISIPQLKPLITEIGSGHTSR